MIIEGLVFGTGDGVATDECPQPDLPTPTVEVEAWSDPVVDALGFDPRSEYVERCWLPVLGPSTVLFLRRMADALDQQPNGFTLDLVETAQALGVGMRGGKNAPMLRTIERSCRFGAVRHQGPGAIAVRRRLAPLTRVQAERLPRSSFTEHEQWVTRPKKSPTFAEVQQWARDVANALAEQGASVDEIEHRLQVKQFHPAVAFDAARRAVPQIRRVQRPEGRAELHPPL